MQLAGGKLHLRRVIATSGNTLRDDTEIQNPDSSEVVVWAGQRNAFPVDLSDHEMLLDERDNVYAITNLFH
jgi:hypothetical protein